MSLRIENFSLSIKAAAQTPARVLFHKLSLKFPAGKISALMGPSGSGKSSLLHFILGALAANVFACSGDVFFNDQRLTDLPLEKRSLGILFQEPLLFPHMTVAANLAFGLAPAVKGKAARYAAILAALGEAQLDAELLQRYPHTLSGGEQARVSLLRTLLSHPSALLLDEPFTSLDTSLRKTFRSSVFASIHKRNLPALMVTHDRQDVAAIPQAMRGLLIELDAKNNVVPIAAEELQIIAG